VYCSLSAADHSKWERLHDGGGNVAHPISNGQALALDHERDADDHANNNGRNDGRNRCGKQVERDGDLPRLGKSDVAPGRGEGGDSGATGVERNPPAIAALAPLPAQSTRHSDQQWPERGLGVGEDGNRCHRDHEGGTDAQRRRKAYGAVLAEDLEQREDDEWRQGRGAFLAKEEGREQSCGAQKRGRIPTQSAGEEKHAQKFLGTRGELGKKRQDHGLDSSC
jgi:hypothetical protein